MNPGYKGRNELPDNLKHLFCPFSLSLPDVSYILECSLFAIGYPDHASTSKKTALLLRVCSDIFSGLEYDFGLRAVKDLLQCIKPGKSIPGCIYNLMLPQMTMKDCNVLRQLITDIFSEEPIEDTLNVEYLALNQVQAHSPRLLRQASHLIAALDSHIGVLLVGTAGAGCSPIKLCADAVNAELVEIAPGALTKAELFGEFDNDTFEWNDGIFTETYRRAPLTPHPLWIVIDGGLDHSWIENLNR